MVRIFLNVDKCGMVEKLFHLITLWEQGGCRQCMASLRVEILLVWKSKRKNTGVTKETEQIKIMYKCMANFFFFQITQNEDFSECNILISNCVPALAL